MFHFGCVINLYSISSVAVIQKRSKVRKEEYYRGNISKKEMQHGGSGVRVKKLDLHL